MSPARPRARQVAVPQGDPLVATSRAPCYADAFEVPLQAEDPRTAEQFARDCLDRAPRAVRALVLVAHRRVLRLRLGDPHDPERVLGWRLARADGTALRLEASGPVVDAVICGRRATPTSVTVVTVLVPHRRVLAAVLVGVVAPVHRRVAPLLLGRAAVPSAQDVARRR